MDQLLGLRINHIGINDKSDSQPLHFSRKKTEAVSETGYDAALAEKVGADAYGMKKYVMAYFYVTVTLFCYLLFFDGI